MSRKRQKLHMFQHRKKSSHSVRQVILEDNLKNSDIGHLVWGKVPGSKIWPGIIVNHCECGMPPPSDHSSWIFWFGDNRISLCLLSKTYKFAENFRRYYTPNHPSVTYRRGVEEILKVCYRRAGLKQENLSSFKDLLQWAEGGLDTPNNLKNSFLPTEECLIPGNVRNYLEYIAKAQTSKSPSTALDEFPTASSSSESDSDAEERRLWRPKALLLKEVKAGSVLLESICIACERGKESCVVAPHPYFQGGLCETCKDAVYSATKSSGDDERYLCAVCSSPGEVIVCDSEFCNKVFCVGCIELLVSPSAVDRIKETDPWSCFLCTPFHPSTHGLLIPKPEWQPKTEVNRDQEAEEEFPEDVFTFCEDTARRPLRVLSLFDGIATGLFVLDKLNLEVEVYYASEVDEDAINVSRMHFGSRITYIGDIQKWSDTKVKSICPIDLLIGGSPCNDLSFVNPQRKGLYDPNGTGILFFHYYRIQKLIQLFNGGCHLFWLFENVSAMSKEYIRCINQFLQRKPVVIDAQYFSAQKRARNFWGNIPDMYNTIPGQITSQNHSLSQILMSECNRKANVEKINCITTNPNSLRCSGGVDWPVVMDNKPDVPWITEIEKIFGFSAHYTDVGNLSVRDRQNLLGRSWSVPVINHILSPLTKLYTLREDAIKHRGEVQSTNTEEQ